MMRVRIGVAAIAAWPVVLAAPALASDRRSAPPVVDMTAVRASAAPRRTIDLRRVRLMPVRERTRSHRLADTVAVGPGDDDRPRARLRGVRLWETVGDDAGFAVGVSPVGGRLMGALRIVR